VQAEPTPVWYVERDGSIEGVIVLDYPDTYLYRQEAKNFPDCRVWCCVQFGWAYMETNKIRSAIWIFATPPDVVVLADLIKG
jgi:hypothetical protein